MKNISLSSEYCESMRATIKFFNLSLNEKVSKTYSAQHKAQGRVFWIWAVGPEGPGGYGPGDLGVHVGSGPGGLGVHSKMGGCNKRGFCDARR